MFNIKWGGIAAGTAFMLAFALSLILGQTSLVIAIFRALVFAALFFGLGMGAWSLISSFLPELLSSAGSRGDITSNLFSTAPAGSQVNITVDDSQNAALPEQSRGAGPGDVGDFNELFSPKNTDGGDIDQIPATGYTEEEEAGSFAAAGDFGSLEESGPNEGEFGSAGESGSSEEFSSAFDNFSPSNGGEDEDEESGFSMDFSAFVPGGGGGDDEGEESESESDFGMDSFSFFPDTPGSSKASEPDPERKVSRNKPMKLEGDFNAKEIAAGLRTVLEKDKK